MGLLPDISGTYRDDLLVLAGRKPEEPDIDAVLLTHAHADHADYISFLHEDIPIYMGDTCHLILKALEERSSRTLEKEVLSFRTRPYNRKEPPIERTVNTFRTGDKFKVGSLEVEPIHVDHSVPGAYGFIIYTSEGPIAYTGDIRLHGTKSLIDLLQDVYYQYPNYAIASKIKAEIGKKIYESDSYLSKQYDNSDSEY